MNQISKTENELIEMASQARQFSYSPYSKFRVGAAIECSDGRVFTGCNVENSSYGLTMCAERVALGKAVSEGATSFTRIAVIADAKAPVPPCGACRQVIHELCGNQMVVIMADGSGRVEVHTINQLLPAAFDGSFL
ncbi:MAG TPA: cytidine deaminase [Blastocatellia bacterium]|nr:cytidine deaminase [Blastocatellia bacterium]